MGNQTKIQLNDIEKVVSTMVKCDDTTLTAALVILPDILGEKGASIVLAAAARIIAESFKDTDQAITKFEESVQKIKQTLSEKK